MRSKIIFFGLFFLFSISLFARGLEWKVHSFFGLQIFPSYSWSMVYISQETYNEAGNYFGDNAGQVGVNIRKLKKGQKIRVEFAANEIMEKTVLNFTPEKDYDTPFFLYPQVMYKWSVLERWVQPKPVNLKISVYVDGVLDDSRSVRIVVRSVYDCPYFVASDLGLSIGVSYVFLSYVNQNHPLITDKILPEIMNENILKSIVGYQETSNGNYSSIYRQVYAVWHYLSQNKLYYSSLQNKFSEDRLPYSMTQYVRPFSEIFASRQASSYDSTILFASILERMGIATYLMLTPERCYLGFALDEAETTIFYLDTSSMGTALNQFNEEDKEYIQNFELTDSDEEFRSKSNNSSTYNEFIAALFLGTLEYQNNQSKFRTNPSDMVFTSDSDEIKQAYDTFSYTILSVRHYRKVGLISMNL